MSVFNKIKTNKITIYNSPTNDTDGVNKEYVDINAFNLISSVRLKTDTLLSYTGSNPLTATSNGALVIDGVTCSTNDRILVDGTGTTSDIHNGIFEVTNTGSPSVPWILTRTTDADENSELNKNSYVFVNEGDTFADTGWITLSDVDIGTSSILWTQFSSAVSGSMKTSTGVIDIDDNTPSAGQVLTATSSTSATWQTPSGGGGGSNFGTEYQYYEDLNEQTTTSTSQVLITTFNTGILPAGDYKISWSVEITNSSRNKYVEFEVRLDDIIALVLIQKTPTVPNQYISQSSFHKKTLTNSSHNLKIYIRRESGSSATAKIKSMRLEIYRLS